MQTLDRDPVSHLAKISARTLSVLQGVCNAQVDSALAADMTNARREVANLDETAFLQALHVLHTYGLVESDISRFGWKVWATRHGWATVIEAEG